MNEEDPGSALNKPDSIVDNLKKMATELMKLRISTIVNEADSQKKLETTINLLDGDISNSMDGAFLRDEQLVPIRDFHAQQIEKGQAVIKGNVDILISLSDKFKEILD